MLLIFTNILNKIIILNNRCNKPKFNNFKQYQRLLDWLPIKMSLLLINHKILLRMIRYECLTEFKFKVNYFVLIYVR